MNRLHDLFRCIACFFLGHYFLWDPRTATWEDYIEYGMRCYRCGRALRPIERGPE